MTTRYLPPASKRNDPRTSYEAELDVTVSGKRATHCDLVLAYVRAHPGQTAGEIGDETKLGRTEAARRLSDLKESNDVYREGRATFSGTSQSMWWPVVSEPTQGALL